MSRPPVTWLVGGPGSAIGGAVLAALLARPGRVAATWHQQPPARPPPGASFHQLDVTDRDAADDLVARLEREEGELAALVYCAGHGAGAPLLLLSPAEWQRSLDVNLNGFLRCARAAARAMAPRRRGTLVLVSSSRAFTGSAGRIAYAASKAGAAGLARALAVELAPSGLAVHVVCPGFQPSRLNRFDERMRAAEAGAALLGIEHSARDAAEFVAFLCEGRLRGVTGQTFHLHGKILPEVEP